MYRHLFLEGPIREGKSTLLRKVLKPYMRHVGGFASQRLVLPDGTTRAFRIGPADKTGLTAPFTENITGGCDGVFRINSADSAGSKFPGVFDTDGVRYLTDTAGKKIMLLDEIGGAEMLSEPFMAALYGLLAGGIPCIGVLKRNKNAAFMSRTAGYAGSIGQLNAELREKIINEYNGKILSFRRDDAGVEEELEDFICGIFTTEQ